MTDLKTLIDGLDAPDDWDAIVRRSPSRNLPEIVALTTVRKNRVRRAAIARRAEQRKQRRRLVLVPATLLLTAVILAGLTYAFRAGPGPQPPGPAEDGSIRVPGELVEAIAVGDALWVLTQEPGCEGPVCSGFVAKVDTRLGEVVEQVPMTSPQAVAAGAGSIWVAGFADDTVVRFDPTTARIEATIPLILPFEVADGDRRFLPFDLDATDDAVWVSTGRGAVAHIDPSTNDIVGMARLPGGTGGSVAIGNVGVWVADSLNGAILVDPVSHRVVDAVRLDDEAGQRFSMNTLVARAGAIWVVGNWARPAEELDGTGYVAGEGHAVVEIDESDRNVDSMLDIRDGPAWLFGGDDLWVVEDDGVYLRRVDVDDRTLSSSVPVPFGRPLAVSGTTAWSAVGESIRSWELPDVSSGTAAAGETPDDMCDFPSVRPTYLPWLPSGQPIPGPEKSQSADGGGPQGLDPGYSTLSWSNGDITRPGTDPNVGGVHLWRATQSVGSFPTDPQVPALPDGSTGRFYASEGGGGDWIIVWADPIADVTDDICSETALVVSFPNLSKVEAKREIVRIAESLVSR